MGFIKQPNGSYINLELGYTVKIVDTDKLEILTKDGLRIISVTDLENIMIGGGL
jgi:hypothetical protein